MNQPQTVTIPALQTRLALESVRDRLAMLATLSTADRYDAAATEDRPDWQGWADAAVLAELHRLTTDVDNIIREIGACAAAPESRPASPATH